MTSERAAEENATHEGVVRVGPFPVVDLTYEDVAERGAHDVSRAEQSRLYALHVGGLLSRDDPEFVAEMNEAETVAADGGSIVLLARLAGARRIERAPTTDLGWDIIRRAAGRLGRPVRVALIGGPEGLAVRAGERLEAEAPCRVIAAVHGYHDEWTGPLEGVRESSPDVCFVGMGAPLEMTWVRRHRGSLPDCAIVTCGGWFGFLAGEEARAPRLIRRSGLEWIARVAQDPVRLLPRYAKGAIASLRVAAPLVWARVRSRLAGRRTP